MPEILSFADLAVDSRERGEEVVFTAQKIKKKNKESWLDERHEPEEEPITRACLVFTWNLFSYLPSRSFNRFINLLVIAEVVIVISYNYSPATIWRN